MIIKSGAARLNGLSFRDGTIEFDMKSIDQDIPGIQFRERGQAGRENAEEFYVRTFPDCRASNDAFSMRPSLTASCLECVPA